MARIIQIKNGLLNQQFIVKNEAVKIGRSRGNLIQLNENTISASHAEIFTEHDQHGNTIYFLLDLNSKNGSFVNRKKVSCRQLKHKDRLRFGKNHFTFIDEKELLNKINNEKITQ